MSTIDQLNAEIARVEAEQDSLFAKKKLIDARLVELYDILADLKNQRDTLLIGQAPGDISLHLTEDGNGSRAANNAAQGFFQDLGLWVSGYYPETQQRGVSLMLRNGKPGSVEQTLAAVKKLLPFVKPLTGGKPVPVRRFGIFEHTLAEYGVYYFDVDDADPTRAKITKMVYYIPSDVTKWMPLRDALQYVHDRHYYERVDANGKVIYDRVEAY